MTFELCTWCELLRIENNSVVKQEFRDRVNLGKKFPFPAFFLLKYVIKYHIKLLRFI